MAEIVKENPSIEIAQAQKAPKLPKADPEMAELLRRKQWAAEVLDGESKIAVAKKEIAQLFKSDSNKQKAAAAVKALAPAFYGGSNLRIWTALNNPDQSQSLNRYSGDLAFVIEELKNVPPDPGLKGILTGATAARTRQIEILDAMLTDAEEALTKLKPYLSDVAGRPRPDKQPDDRRDYGQPISA